MFKKKSDEDAKPIEQEIAELQRKFRVAENAKRHCIEESQSAIRKQRAAIEKLTRENRQMKAELSETRSVVGTAAENKMALETMGKLNEQRESLLGRMDSESDLSLRLQDDEEAKQRQIFSLREDLGRVGGVNASLDNNRSVQKQIRILENRLDHAMTKFNDSITANRSLREQIDTLRRERVVFDDIYRKLENELLQKKREMANIIDQANSAYEARDSAQAQMASLKQQADKEHAEFEREWKELGKLIEHDKRMKEFMKTKLKNKEERADAIRDEEQHMKRSAKHEHTTKSLVAASANQERVAEYDEAFNRIHAATGICDIDELVENFLIAEDTNFSLFKYNNELSADIEKLEQQIQALQEEYVVLSGSSSRKEDTEKAKILETLEEKCNDLDRRAISYEVRHHESIQTLNHIRTSIESIFRRLGCTAEDLPSGCGGAISEANMMQYLAVIERRSNELLKLYSAQHPDDDVEALKPNRPGQASANLQINRLPSTVEDYSDDEDDDDDDEQRPFTKEELKSKTMKNLTKKGKKTKMRATA